MGSGREPVEYELLIAQLAASLDLLEQLKAEPPSPKVNLSIVMVEEARWRMLNALAAYESADRSS